MTKAELGNYIASDTKILGEEGVNSFLEPVYHQTDRWLLQSIFKSGLITAGRVRSISTNSRMEKLRIDEIFDKYASKLCPGFSRQRAIYASPQPRKVAEPFSWTAITLKIMVDPNAVVVADQTVYDYATSSFRRGNLDEVVNYAMQYWQEAVTLKEYGRQKRQKVEKFRIPEVLIPNSVSRKRISGLIKTP